MMLHDRMQCRVKLGLFGLFALSYLFIVLWAGYALVHFVVKYW